MDMASDKTTLYLPRELHRALKEAARREGKPQAELVRGALEEYLSKRPRPAIGSIGAGADEELSASRSEEWLADEWG